MPTFVYPIASLQQKSGLQPIPIYGKLVHINRDRIVFKMDVIHLLTSLPVSISSGILQEFLDLKSLKTFDSCCLNKSARKDLLSVIRSEDDGMYEKVITASHIAFQWMKGKSASARIVVIEDGMNSGKNLHHAADYLLKFGAKVDSIEILQGCSSVYIDATQLVAKNCCNLKSVTFSCKRYDENLGLSILCDVLRANRNVQKLYIDFKTDNYSIDDFAQLLPFCRDLRCLRLSSSPVKDEVLVAFAKACSHIAHLDISGCADITDAGVGSIAVHLKGLQSLNISNCFGLTSQSLVHLSTYCATTLHALNLNVMGDEGLLFNHDVLDTLFESCVNIRTLSWIENDTETSYALPSSIKHVTTLTLVDEAVTDANLTTIATHCAHLTNLYLECSDNVEEVACTEEGLHRLVSACAQLRELTLNGFYDHPQPNFEDLVDTWRETKPQLHICEDEKGPTCFEFDVMKM